jgi:hypothetical protein
MALMVGGGEFVRGAFNEARHYCPGKCRHYGANGPARDPGASSTFVRFFAAPVSARATWSGNRASRSAKTDAASR